MARFRQCQAKVRNTSKTDAGRDNVYKPIWFAYEKMAAFLQYKDEPRKTINSVQIEMQLESTNDREDMVKDIDDVHKSQQHDDNSILHVNGPDDVQSPMNTGQELQICTTEVDHTSKFKAPSKKIHKNHTVDTGILEKRMEDAYNILKSATKRRENSQGKDECGIYGDLVASKLRQLDEVTTDYVMNQTDNFLFQAKKSRINCNNERLQLRRNAQWISPLQYVELCSPASQSPRGSIHQASSDYSESSRTVTPDVPPSPPSSTNANESVRDCYQNFSLY